MPKSPPLAGHTVVELVAPYRDTRAEDLCWSLTLPVQPALAVRTVRLGPFVLELRLLGASHQVLVWTDMLGLTQGRVPKFVKQYADLRQVMGDAVKAYAEDVVGGTFPLEEHSVH